MSKYRFFVIKREMDDDSGAYDDPYIRTCVYYSIDIDDAMSRYSELVDVAKADEDYTVEVSFNFDRGSSDEQV